MIHREGILTFLFLFLLLIEVKKALDFYSCLLSENIMFLNSCVFERILIRLVKNKENSLSENFSIQIGYRTYIYISTVSSDLNILWPYRK